MTAEAKNKIENLRLKNFTCFSEIDINFSPGINVFIGENGTGKTHLLKILYSFCKNEDHNGFIRAYFGLSSNAPLIRRSSEVAGIGINVSSKGKTYGYQHTIKNSESESGLMQYDPEIEPFNNHIEPVYLPPQEMLSWFRGFINLYKNRQIGFDRTYFDLAVALDGPLLTNSAYEKARSLIEKLEEVIDGTPVRNDDGGFLVQFNHGGKHESVVIASGINKIAQIIFLVKNGSINKNTILFWDEPEAGLNPKYVTVIAEFIQILANHGIQLFVATHDYLLLQQLSINKEYQEVSEKPVPSMKFFSLYSTEDGTKIESGQTLPELEHNAILDEFAAYYDWENSLLKKTITT